MKAKRVEKQKVSRLKHTDGVVERVRRKIKARLLFSHQHHVTHDDDRAAGTTTILKNTPVAPFQSAAARLSLPVSGSGTLQQGSNLHGSELNSSPVLKFMS